MIHVLHIAKAGGTALRHALEGTAGLQFHDHATTLFDLGGESAIFAVRHPFKRFASGFYSRRRMGRPRYFGPWSEDEAIAFARFPTPDRLASALDARDGETRDAAHRAMVAIGHVRRSMTYWLGSPEQFTTRAASVRFIAHQPDLATDFEVIRMIVGRPDAVLPVDPVASHRNPADCDYTLGVAAKANLARWYAPDLVLYQACLALREERLGGRR